MHTPEQPKRRKFLKIASAGSIAGATGGIPSLFVSNQAVAEELLGAASFATLTKIARDIFPHDQFDDGLYVKAVAIYGDQIKEDPALRKLLIDGIAAADQASMQQFGKPYIQIPDEKNRLVILTAMEKTPFFAKIRGDLVVSLYNQPTVWGKLGYQGSSAELGGYINRGFNDQNWMELV
ncbi:gluconate 2-dehydrogenase subunit 3 family protein [Glaciimonas sp. GG7]